MCTRACQIATRLALLAFSCSLLACRSAPPTQEERDHYYALVGVCEAADRLRTMTDENVAAKKSNTKVSDLAVLLAENSVWRTASERTEELHIHAIHLARCSARYAFAYPDGSLTKQDNDYLDAAIRNVRADLEDLRGFGDSAIMRKDAGDAVMKILSDGGPGLSMPYDVARFVERRAEVSR